MTTRSASKSNRLRVQHEFDVPLREISGICLRRCRNRRMSLIAVGDRVATLAWVHLPRRDDGDADRHAFEWNTIDIARVPGSRLPARDPQIEAVCADGAGRVLLLQEAPPRAELLDMESSRVVATIALEVKGRDELARSWSDPHGSRGEGAVLLSGGHLLVAKEKDPAVLIEFGPKGARSRGLTGGSKRGGALADGARWPVKGGDHRYVALAVWQPDKKLRKACDDFSDLEIGPDGRLYLLSDKSATIARLDHLQPGSGTASMSVSWRLEGINAKPEGLSFAADGRAIVALDKRKRRNNVVLLEPAIAR